MRLRLAGALVGIAVLAQLTGCGGSAPEAKQPPAQVQHDAVAALNDYLEAFQSGEAKKACALETPEYARTQVADAVAANLLSAGATCEDLVTAAIAAAKQLGANFATVASASMKVVDSSPDRVTVRVTYPAGQVASTESYGLALVDGAWLVASKKSTVTQATPTPK